jgi:hypothetical protein
MCLLIACASQKEVGSGASFRLSLGATARAAGAIVRFVEVASDSRCPAAVTCVWEGDADVRIAVNDEIVSVHTASSGPRSARVEGLTIELIELRPRPSASPATNVPYEVELRAIASAR